MTVSHHKCQVLQCSISHAVCKDESRFRHIILLWWENVCWVVSFQLRPGSVFVYGTIWWVKNSKWNVAILTKLLYCLIFLMTTNHCPQTISRGTTMFEVVSDEIQKTFLGITYILSHNISQRHINLKSDSMNIWKSWCAKFNNSKYLHHIAYCIDTFRETIEIFIFPTQVLYSIISELRGSNIKTRNRVIWLINKWYRILNSHYTLTRH